MISCLKKKNRLRCPLPSLPQECWVLSVGLGEALGPTGAGRKGAVFARRPGMGGVRQGDGELGVGRSPRQGVSSGALTITEMALSHTLPGSSGGAVGWDPRCPQRRGPRGLGPCAVLRAAFVTTTSSRHEQHTLIFFA